MTREEKISRLSQIRVLVTNPVLIYDMGVQFDAITDKGALTDIWNIVQWSFLRFFVSDNLLIPGDSRPPIPVIVGHLS